MVEWFASDEIDFGLEVIVPQFLAVQSELGVKPLVVQLIAPDRAEERNCHAYPKDILRAISELESESMRNRTSSWIGFSYH